MKQADPLSAYRRALQPANGTATRDELLGLPACAQPRDRTQLAAWAAETRRLLVESPLRSLMSAAIEARRVVESGACSREDGVRGAGRRETTR